MVEKKKNVFFEYVDKIGKENPNIKSRKELIKLASKTYKKINDKEDKK